MPGKNSKEVKMSRGMDSKELSRRLGRVRITRVAFDSMNQDGLRLLFSDFFPLRVEQSDRYWNLGESIYYGRSSQFKELDEGSVVPIYHCGMTKTQVFFTEDVGQSLESVAEHLFGFPEGSEVFRKMGILFHVKRKCKMVWEWIGRFRKVKKKYLAFDSGYIRFKSGMEINWSIYDWSLPLNIEFSTTGLFFLRILCISFIFKVGSLMFFRKRNRMSVDQVYDACKKYSADDPYRTGDYPFED